MISMRYRKVSGVHAGQTYVVIEPHSEIEANLRWVLHNEGNPQDKPLVPEGELNDPKLWQPLE